MPNQDLIKPHLVCSQLGSVCTAILARYQYAFIVDMKIGPAVAADHIKFSRSPDLLLELSQHPVSVEKSCLVEVPV